VRREIGTPVIAHAKVQAIVVPRATPARRRPCG
jgi:hypothetical protein